MRIVKIVAMVVPMTMMSACSDIKALSSSSPSQAIGMAAKAAPNGAKGTFSLRVKSVGYEDGKVYLHSEIDYRDQRNVSIVIEPAADKALALKYGRFPETAFQGRTLTVKGRAKQVRIDFVADGVNSGKYYYQTQIDVTKANQISIMP